MMMMMVLHVEDYGQSERKIIMHIVLGHMFTFTGYKIQDNLHVMYIRQHAQSTKVYTVSPKMLMTCIYMYMC